MRKTNRSSAVKTMTRFGVLSFFTLLLALASASLTFAENVNIPLGDSVNFVILYEGNGNNQLQTNNTTMIPAPGGTGNIGIGDPSGSTALFAANGPGTIAGSVEFDGAVNDWIHNTTITGTVTGGNTNVQTDLNNLNTLSSTLGGATGSSLSINTGWWGGGQTVNESAGTLQTINGVTYRVFTVTGLQFNNWTNLTINGDGSGDPVVFNISSSNVHNPQFNGAITLTGGLTADQVLFNITGSNNNQLQINTNGATESGDFLDPNGAIQVNNSVLDGRVFGGGSQNMQINNSYLAAPDPPPVPVPEPRIITLLAETFLLVLGAAVVARRRIAWPRA